MTKPEILATLTSWQNGISDFEDEGLISPNSKVIDFAIKLVEHFSFEDFGPRIIPSVVPDGQGGLVFELWKDQEIDETIRIDKDLKKTLCKFKDCKLVSQQTL